MHRLLVVVVLGLSSLVFGQNAPQAPVAIYSGDGLTVRVLAFSEDTGEVSGEIVQNDNTFPFSGKHAESDAGEVVHGTFTAGGQSYEFSTKQVAGSQAIEFTTAGSTYRLLPVVPADAAPPVAPKEDGPVNPLQRKPDPAAPPAPEARNAPAPQGANAAAPAVMRLKQHVFPDVSMGAQAAYVALTPDDWKSEGVIEWMLIGEVPFPQTTLTITSPAGGRLKYVPNVTFSYWEIPSQGKQQGEPAPADFPRWLVEAVPRYNTNITNLQLVSSQRDEKLEAQHAQNDRAIGQNTEGSRRECWVIVLDYDEDGVRRRQESSVMYCAFKPYIGTNGFNSQSWGIFSGPSISAPVDRFDTEKAMLYQVIGTVRPTVRWFTASQAQIAENSRVRGERIWEGIKRRGEQIKNMHITPADESAYSKGVGSDSAQRTRINSIYETDDYRDTDGNSVNLPMHYKHVFSDGNGNYVLSNNSLDKPGEQWNEIQPAK